MVSLFVVTLNNLLVFSVLEENSYYLMRRLEFKEQIREKAILALGSAFKHKWARHKTPEKLHKIASTKQKFKQRMRDFQKSVWSSRKFVEPENETEVVQKLIENLTWQV